MWTPAPSGGRALRCDALVNVAVAARLDRPGDVRQLFLREHLRPDADALAAERLLQAFQRGRCLAGGFQHLVEIFLLAAELSRRGLPGLADEIDHPAHGLFRC